MSRPSQVSNSLSTDVMSPVWVTKYQWLTWIAGPLGLRIWPASSDAPPAGGVQSIQPMLPGPFAQNGSATRLLGPVGQSWLPGAPYGGSTRPFEPLPGMHCSSITGKVTGMSAAPENVDTY